MVNICGGENDGETNGGNTVNNDSNGDRLAYSVVTHSASLVICQGISHLLVGPPSPPPTVKAFPTLSRENRRRWSCLLAILPVPSLYWVTRSSGHFANNALLSGETHFLLCSTMTRWRWLRRDWKFCDGNADVRLCGSLMNLLTTSRYYHYYYYL